MTILFNEYELLARSGLFDAAFYLRTNPAVAALNVDPLLHYVESGAAAGLDPSAAFDTRYYRRQCRRIGVAPANALVHYLTEGLARGLKPKAGARPPAPGPAPAPAPSGPSTPAHSTRHGVLYIDNPRITDGVAQAPVRGGLLVVGWGFIGGPVAQVEVLVDGRHAAQARHGLRRPDVAAVNPTWPEALLSGFAAHLPPKALPAGRRRVTVEMRAPSGLVARSEFSVDVQELSDTAGPWTLRHKMREAEVDAQRRLLAQRGLRPRFRILLAPGTGRAALAAARLTLGSLARQTYPDWELCALAADRPGRPGRVAAAKAVAALLAGYEELAPRVRGAPHAAARQARAPGGTEEWVLRLAPGDQLGCDALLEFAVAAALEREAEFIYADDRRFDAALGRVNAFFKPGWSPDLLLDRNYIGRAWCAKRELIDRVGLGLEGTAPPGDYAVTLRLTEAAARIRHVPRVLLEATAAAAESPAAARRALSAALERRGIDARVEPGRLAGQHRVRRSLAAGTVSIIIPTCAADGLIKTCIESLRARTAYRDFEIVCVENIPQLQRNWQEWIRAHADVVVEARTPFNWSRYNNLGARRARGEYLLFLNDDIEVHERHWLEALLEQVQRPEVGVVGAQLSYPTGSIQHAGVMLDDSGRGRHAFRHLASQEPGYFGLAQATRNVLSVTGACLMTRRATFERLGGFDEAHAVINNDLDFCLRAWAAGLLNVYTPHARLVHHELGSRARVAEDYDMAAFRARWGALIASGDPYFNPNLVRTQDQLMIDVEPLETLHTGRPLYARERIRRILVVKLDHIGDAVVTVPALRRLERHFPDARITVLAGRSTRAVWEAERAVAEILEFDFFHARSGEGGVAVTPRALAALEAQLAARRFDLAIDLRKQPDTRELLRLSGAPLLAGYDTHGRFPWLDIGLEWGEDVPLRAKRAHVADDLIALVEAVAAQGEPDAGPVRKAPSEPRHLPAALRRLFAKPLICVHPGAGNVMRQWPLAQFAELIRLLVGDAGHHVALVGGPDERAFVPELLAADAGGGRVFDLVGRLSLRELESVVARAALFVGNDSGPKHLAASLGVPTIGIHSGVIDAAEWGPLAPRSVALRRAMSCSPCYIERPADCQRGLACLTEIPVAAVYQASMRALARPMPDRAPSSTHV